jgi:hypothetical protein
VRITPTTRVYSGTYNNVTVPPGQTCELSGQLASASEGSGWVSSSVITGDLVINATTADPAVAGDWGAAASAAKARAAQATSS